MIINIYNKINIIYCINWYILIIKHINYYQKFNLYILVKNINIF